MSFTLYFLYEGTVYSENKCATWITFNYSLFQLSIFLMTWTSVERYFFIYHERFIMRHIILLHYGPITILILYCSVLYVGIVILYTCQPAYDIHTVYLWWSMLFIRTRSWYVRLDWKWYIDGT